MRNWGLPVLAAGCLLGSLPGMAQPKPGPAQSKPGAALPKSVGVQPKPEGPPAAIAPWEYLVISFGKTTFSDPVLDPELKQAGQSKILFYSNAGIINASEALSVQRQMDSLGRFGWELVGVVGTIGGDQQMLFKRPFDANRSSKEAQLIKEEGERIAEEQRKIRERQSTQKEMEGLVDLDMAERQAGIDAEAKLLSNDLQSYKELPVKVLSLDAGQTPGGIFKAAIRVQVDGSSKLLKENKFRSSEADKLAEEVAKEIFRASKLGEGTTPSLSNVKISISVVVKHGGKDQEVGFANVGGERAWSDGMLRHR